MKNKSFVVIAAFSMALAVMFGALGAHALKSILSEASLMSWKTAVLYQVIHSLALIFIVIFDKVFSLQNIKIVLRLMTIGFVAFSGSIYLLAFKEVVDFGVMTKVLGPITPIGGLLMISAWIMLGVKVLRYKNKE